MWSFAIYWSNAQLDCVHISFVHVVTSKLLNIYRPRVIPLKPKTNHVCKINLHTNLRSPWNSLSIVQNSSVVTHVEPKFWSESLRIYIHCSVHELKQQCTRSLGTAADHNNTRAYAKYSTDITMETDTYRRINNSYWKYAFLDSLGYYRKGKLWQIKTSKAFSYSDLQVNVLISFISLSRSSRLCDVRLGIGPGIFHYRLAAS